MTSLVDSPQGFVCAPKQGTDERSTEVEEERIVFAVMVAFLAGGAALALYGVAQAELWL